MKVLADTAVLVAALVTVHPHHARARVWLQAADEKKLDLGFTLHAIAETYSVLTKIPYPAKFSGDQARRALDTISRIADVVDADRALYFAAVERCATLGLVSGAIFDALHVVSAERWGADAILTFNESDFVRLSVATTPRVVVPPDPPAVVL